MTPPTPGAPAAYVSGLPMPDRTLVMGVVNVTPDSFSDGGQWFEPSDAVAHGLRLVAQGADIVDVGGESTRPGAERPTVDEELRRVLPVVRELTTSGVVVSVDTMRAEVAERALAVGAGLVNDVSGGMADPSMLSVVAAADVPIVLMHWRGHSALMQDLTMYDDVVADVAEALRERVDAAVTAGVAADRIAIDPGLGFSKTWDHNWQILAHLSTFVDTGLPVLLAASRKTFLGELLADPTTGERRPPAGRDAATAALSTVVATAGAWCVRVHDIPSTVDAVKVARRLGAETST